MDKKTKSQIDKRKKELYFHAKENGKNDADLENLQTKFNEEIGKLQTQFADKIQNLENQLQNVGGGNNIGTSVAEISALMNDYLTEEDFCTAASEKLQFGAQCKVEYAPHARVFFRHNPLKTLSPTITLGFWVSPLPSGITRLPATITLNGTTIFNGALDITATSGQVAQITLSINRAQCPMQVFNVLEIAITDDAFASAFLDWLTVDIAQSQNCIILNRSTDHEIYGQKRTSGVHRIYDTRYLGAGVYKYVGGDDVDITAENATLNFFETNEVDDIGFKNQVRHILQCYNLNFDLKYNFLLYYDFELLLTQENKFYLYTTYFTNDKVDGLEYFLEDILYAKHSLHTGNDWHILHICAVHNDFSIGAYNGDLYMHYYLNFFEKYDMFLSNESYPSEFVDFVPVKDFFVSWRIGLQSCGFFLLHQSGNIIFIPNINSSYFIKIGKGRQINAFFCEDGNSIIVTYQHNQSVIKKTLSRQSAESDWVLDNNEEFLINTNELYFCGDKQYSIFNNIIK